LHPVTKPKPDVAQVHRQEALESLVQQRLDPLDRENLGRQAGQDRSLVPAARPDLQNAMRAVQFQPSVMIATMYGWLIVCPCPIGAARSS